MESFATAAGLIFITLLSGALLLALGYYLVKYTPLGAAFLGEFSALGRTGAPIRPLSPSQAPRRLEATDWNGEGGGLKLQVFHMAHAAAGGPMAPQHALRSCIGEALNWFNQQPHRLVLRSAELALDNGACHLVFCYAEHPQQARVPLEVHALQNYYIGWLNFANDSACLDHTLEEAKRWLEESTPGIELRALSLAKGRAAVSLLVWYERTPAQANS